MNIKLLFLKYLNGQGKNYYMQFVKKSSFFQLILLKWIFKILKFIL